MLYNRSLVQFVKSNDTFRVYHENALIFASQQELLDPLLHYINIFAPRLKDVTIFDRVVGNAAALLLKKAFCREVYSPLGSKFAAQTLERQGIVYHFSKTVPYILNQKGDGICPMEKLSLGRNPEEFHELLKRSKTR